MESVLFGLVLICAGGLGLVVHRRRRPDVPGSARVLAWITAVGAAIGPGFFLLMTQPSANKKASQLAYDVGSYGWLGLLGLLALAYVVLRHREHRQTKALRSMLGLKTLRMPVRTWVPLTIWLFGFPLLATPVMSWAASELLPSTVNVSTTVNVLVYAILTIWGLGTVLIVVVQPYRRRKRARRQEDADHAVASLEWKDGDPRPPVWIPMALARSWARLRDQWWSPVKPEDAQKVLASAATLAVITVALMGAVQFSWWQYPQTAGLEPSTLLFVQVLGSFIVLLSLFFFMVFYIGSTMWLGLGTALSQRKPKGRSHSPKDG